jgi:hypothetical protein
MRGPQRELAKHGVVKPRFVFDDASAGGIEWDSLPFVDQTAVVGAIMEVSGFGKSDEAVKRFPDGHGERRSDGADADAAGADAAAAVGATGSTP